MEIDYYFIYHDEVDVREIGLAFDVRRECDRLSWNRNAQWTYYPSDHIGRAKGNASAFRSDNDLSDNPFSEPSWPWYLDATSEGNNDFRSTKRNIISYALESESGIGMCIRSDGDQHARAYVDKDQIKVLIKDYSNMGDQIFRWWEEGKRLLKGHNISGKIRFVLRKTNNL